jgi:FMN phosphatase YigB (HAD superfamily)
MPLTLEQYAAHLDTRRDLSWPAAPEIDRPKAKPHLIKLPHVRAVLWNVYGTLLSIAGGELVYEHPQAFVMGMSLEKTIQEFKMWAAMSRKPGQPADYLIHIYTQELTKLRMASGGGEKFPEISAERVWDAIVKKLLQKEYKFDATFFGSLNDFSRKIAYFFHASLQGTACYPGAAEAMQQVAAAGLTQGLLGDAQSFTLVQLQRGLTEQDAEAKLDALLSDGPRALSYEIKGRKPSERLFRHALDALHAKGLEPSQVLHVGSRIVQDIAPARRLGMRTALFAGDKASLQATPEQLKDAANRPDVMLTELNQIAELIAD